MGLSAKAFILGLLLSNLRRWEIVWSTPTHFGDEGAFHSIDNSLNSQKFIFKHTHYNFEFYFINLINLDTLSTGPGLYGGKSVSCNK